MTVSETVARDAAIALHVVSLDHPLGPLREVRADAVVAAQAEAAGTQLLAQPECGAVLATLSADTWLPELLDLAIRLLWSQQHAATRAVLGTIREIGKSISAPSGAESGGEPPPRGAASRPPWHELCEGYSVLTELTDVGLGGPGTTEERLSQVASDLCSAADHYLAGGDRRRAALVASAALWVLFHQELHDARPTSPLVSDPDQWLLPLTNSRVGELLTGEARATRTSEDFDASHHPGLRTRPLVLSGAYPRFAVPVIEALQREPGLTVTALALSEVDKPFKRMGVEPWLVELRLTAALGEPVNYEPLESALAGSDTVLADWADAGAMLASLLKPPGTALTVRAHSVDALRCWLHLIDWSAVDQLICVGPHIQDLIDAQLGDRLAHARHTVLPNLVQLGRFDHPRAADTDHTLAMVGWARAVKDPLWTVELLARLRAHDPRWRLLLVGHRFPAVLPPTGRDYARRFAARTKSPDVRKGIEYVAFTNDLAPVLARAGWVVSSSVRESWGVGPMEAVAAGAVPVIRNWPLFASLGGPRRLYPDHWVFDSLEQAEERILAITAEGQREAVAQESKNLLSGLFNPLETAAGYRTALTTIRAVP